MPQRNNSRTIKQNHYDYIISGGGCAGLSLAYHLNQTELCNKSILILDRSSKRENDRTWCFWTKNGTIYDSIVHRRFKALEFIGTGFSNVFDMGDWEYHWIQGIDFYRFVQKDLQKNPNIVWKYGEINRIEDTQRGATVVLDGQVYTADYVFNSCFNEGKIKINPKKQHFIQQHFKGWVIETPKAVFNPAQFTMFDFRTPQPPDDMRFFYILPESPHKAMVEYTIFGEELMERSAYDPELKRYIKEVLGIEEYTIEEEEFGRIPMTDFPLPRKTGKHIRNLGINGGRARPSTGYAFLSIQNDVAGITQQLLQGKAPFQPENVPK
ncbi:MAG: lycopene cyclase family protein, partial [Chitinophagales bacterium]